LGAAAFFGALLIVVAFEMGLAVVEVVLDFLGCGASTSSSSDAFLFAPVVLVTVVETLASFAAVFAEVVLPFAAVLVLVAALGAD